jgi:hypothetical protein
MSYPKPSELWDMNPDDFNKWRRENDLKKLFENFQKSLHQFDDWLQVNNLTIDFILETNNPGQFFYYDKETYCIKTNKENCLSYFFVPVYNERDERRIQKTKLIDTDKEKTEKFKFKPYFTWIKEQRKVDKSIKTKRNELETFRYTTGTAPDVPEICSWSIAAGGTVLKLGGVKIDGWFKLNDRNLDFTNLDFLEIDGKESWNSEIQIFFSHCVNISTNNVVANFTKFYQCTFGNFKVTNSRFYWVEFYSCDIFKAYFENSNISNMIIEDCSANSFSFNRVEVENIDYTPPTKEHHCEVVMTNKTVADNYKRFRILYQANGLRREASEAYYNERLYEMKYNWGNIDLLKSFSSIKYNFQKLIKSISDSISYFIWGFGERPLRIVSSSLLVLSTYALIYYFSGIAKLNHDIINSFYLSVVTFTTLGFGDITPMSNNSYKLIVGSEALIGAFCMGLLVAGYANKSRY